MKYGTRKILSPLVLIQSANKVGLVENKRQNCLHNQFAVTIAPAAFLKNYGPKSENRAKLFLVVLVICYPQLMRMSTQGHYTTCDTNWLVINIQNSGVTFIIDKSHFSVKIHYSSKSCDTLIFSLYTCVALVYLYYLYVDSDTSC